jgi:hypothetical protein
MTWLEHPQAEFLGWNVSLQLSAASNRVNTEKERKKNVERSF